MNQPEAALPADAGPCFARALALAGALAMIVGAKLWLIAGYGSSTPFWDEWVEPVSLFRPYLAGQLSIHDLLAAHNEHRIFLTRLVALALFVAEGRWDPLATILVNAAIHGTAIGLVLVMLSRTLDAARTWIVAFLAALLFVLPLGWANTLVAFQTQFYLLVLLAPASLWLLCASTAWSLRWWVGTLLGIVSYFSIASGALTLPAFIALAGVQIATGRRQGVREWLGVIAQACLAVVIIRDIPVVPGHQVLSPGSLRDWLAALSSVASWPVSKASWSQLANILVAVGLYAPVIVLTGTLLRRRAPVRDPHWLLVGLAGWIGLQLLALVYGRGVAVLQSRYYDILLLAPLINAATLLSLHLEADARWRRGLTLFACAWFAAVIIGLGQKAFDGIPSDLAWRERTTAAQTQNLKNYLATGDFAALENKPEFDVPYPDIGFLRDTVSDPVIRAILPPDLLGRPEPENRLKRLALRQGALLLPIGIALFIIAALLMLARREADSRPAR